MAGKLFNVFVIVLLLGIFALATEASTGGKPLKKKSVPEKTGNKYSFSDDDELMFADQSGDGPDDNESIDELDPDFSVDGLPDLNELLPEGEIDAVIPTRRPAYRPPATVKPPCGQAGKPCQSANRPPCQAGRPCQNANPPQSANPPKPCQSAGRPCSQAKPQPCQSGRPCTQAKPTPCKTSKPCPSVKPPPCQTGRRCQTARRPCYSKRTCQTKRPCQTKRLCQSPAPIIPPAFSPTVVCGKSYYCRKGYQGPCNRNEIFTPNPIAIARPIQPTCPSIGIISTGCISSKNPLPVKSVSSNPGYCAIRYTQKPCYGYPSTFRYCQNTKLCYPTSPTPIISRSKLVVPSPCPVDQFFTAVDLSYGFCRCSRPNYVRCQKTNRCYPAYTKGTCSIGQWMVPYGNQGLSTCQICPCPSKADGRHIYWSGQFGRPGCYKSQTRGPCRQGMRFVISDILTGSSRCVPNYSMIRKQPSSGYNSLMNDWNLFYGGLTR
ncbi:neurogenic locus notch homolog protein 3-like [Daphnia pulicaria]|uniref:neurogenic locus notch homolog protein 3-like n=1 Tax=Daphnia pulicaria TaxID=35523 RepID=UPI001EEC37F8|nr:neurogenic locus notch homolog protein 3-like [Daphnia pulicaria]